MKESELKHFVDSTLQYFQNATGEAATLGVPYIKKSDEDVYCDFTGIIGISGSRRGAIYVCCPRPLLEQLAAKVTGLAQVADDAVRDMAGELANTIAGNATRAFDRNFQISVPVIVEGKPKSISLKLESPVYVLPAQWKNNKFAVIVGISD
ncbi:MAG: chemotaxis protein CheX [Turneriella sp.]|nr:chemotaxis protein CheX [Leptospiraceae bacterium]MCX7631743.1 chemotaxis protein CheX [Turneriella sp.]